MNKSAVYKFRGRLFRYDFDCNIVELVTKATREEKEDNMRWQFKFGRNLWDIDDHGYIIVDEIGMQRSNWQNKDERNEYLSEWVEELDYMAQTYVRQFV